MEVLVNNTAEARAAQVRVEFAERDTVLRKEERTSAALRQADIDAELDLLKHKKKGAALTAEANELANLVGSEFSLASYLPVEDPIVRVQNYVEHKIEPINMQNNAKTSENSKIVQFLLRKVLVLSRLTTFNDSCSNYHGWKTSFLSFSQEMSLCSSEEIDLLIKYLGWIECPQASV